MARAKKGKIQCEAPRYNLNNPTSSNQQKCSPAERQNKVLSKIKYVLPLFVTKCQRAIKIHYQEEVAVKIVETMPTLHAIHESHQAHPPKFVHEPPERSRHDPTYVECLNHPK